ncbi:hypothetical protein DdX_04091 [Ditylenchus destructor]|uniref:Uncharacterized protein n=1 Tax=Ditylenchus destructor TaxID=166010 RepID=A0AAD4RBT3_9BILA|nr:hypothetical protein DdX_04091 [Ditylenchus destructor]
MLDCPKNSGLTQEESAGPKNLRVRAAEGREGRPHPNAGLTLSQEREDGSSPEGAGKKTLHRLKHGIQTPEPHPLSGRRPRSRRQPT